MFKIKSLLSDKILLIIILFISLIVNQFSGNRGVFPVDSFAFFDTGYRVLNGEFPFKDFWTVSGAFIDYFQALLFLILGTNWQVYIFHASFINAIFAISTFLLLKELKLSSYNSFFYTVCLSILAYPSSGSPFVDHHSAFLSIIGTYCLIFAYKKEENIFWILIPFIFGFAFLSKQVPSAYFIIFVTFIILLNFFLLKGKKNLKIITLLISSSFSFIILVLFIFFLNKVNINQFLDQYLLYPLSIGDSRFSTYKINFENFFIKYKFVHLVFLPYLVINIKKIINFKKYYQQFNFTVFLIFVFSVITLISHQILTKNQNFIFFLIPLLAALSHIEIKSLSHRLKKILTYLLIGITIFSTIKYHQRFNLERKFHELNYVDFKNVVDAKIIHKKFSGLNWITPNSSDKEKNLKEINNIIKTQAYLKKDKRRKVVISNYAFLSIILNESTKAPNRWYPMDGTGFPLPGNKFFSNYKNFFINILKNNHIEVIFVSKDIEKDIVLNYLNKDCFEQKQTNSYLIEFILNKNCKDLK